jgi:hypothetical protein
MIKRIQNEINANKNINVISFDIDEGKKEIVLNFIISTNNRKYSIVFDSSYPFKPPKKFSSNGISYFKIMKVPSTRFSTILKKITGQECFCCYSSMCGSNWSPCSTIQKIINESNDVCKIKQMIVEKIIADSIKKKYLNDDINLDQWIY